MNDGRPVFQQIMETIERDIITGVYKTDDLIISTTEISKIYSVNPATAVKAVGRLTEAGILYKDRGIGMRVAAGARGKITDRRKAVFLNETIDALLAEAEALGIPVEKIMKILKERDERRKKKA